jgi:hypothetical protein
MSRFFLALALVSQLSGFAGAAAVVCEVEMARSHPCCCHHEQSGASLPTLPQAVPACPCAMAPPLPPPVTQTPVTVSALRVLAPMPAVVTAALHTLAQEAQWVNTALSTPAPAAQSALSASHLRC